jgi:hypothetical protein
VKTSGNVWKEAILAKVRYYPGVCLDGRDKPTETFKIGGVSGKIQIKYFRETALEHYLMQIYSFSVFLYVQ